jgi:hypothetical protein
MLLNFKKFLKCQNTCWRFLFIFSLVSQTSFAETLQERFAKFFMVRDIEIVEGQKVSSFEQARYQEFGPLVLIEIIKSNEKIVYYTETNDEGGIVVSLDLMTNEITTILQGHNIRCAQLLKIFPYKENRHFLCKSHVSL